MKDESDHKGSVVKLYRLLYPEFTVLAVQDNFTSGVPDVTVNGKKKTTWWEFKLERPKRHFESKRIQEITMMELAERSWCARYVIYDMVGDQIRIVEPKHLDVWRTSGISTKGFDHRWVVEYIRRAHD